MQTIVLTLFSETSSRQRSTDDAHKRKEVGSRSGHCSVSPVPHLARVKHGAIPRKSTPKIVTAFLAPENRRPAIIGSLAGLA
jgi:hypothetical protein